MPRTQLPYSEGIFRRRIRFAFPSALVVIDLEDDFHRFHLELRHDGNSVTGVSSETIRAPWSACPDAIPKLDQLVGMPLTPRVTDTLKLGGADRRSQCTHLFDLSCLAIAHTALGTADLVYDIAVPDRAKSRGLTTLRQNGELKLEWEVDGLNFVGPELYAGQTLRSTFPAWVESVMGAEAAVGAIALRRACIISSGRMMDLDEVRDASAYLPMIGGSCHTFTEGIAQKAIRTPNTSHEFTHRADELLSDL